MPTYEFRCPQGHEFEKFYRSISGAEAQAACPVCNQLADRMMSATSFAFKGSGFYKTDYASKKDSGGSKGESKSDSGSGSSSGSSSDSGGGGTKSSE